LADLAEALTSTQQVVGGPGVKPGFAASDAARSDAGFVCGRIHTPTKNEGQDEKAKPGVAENRPHCATHPRWTATQRSTPDILLFEVPSQSIHHKDRGQKNDEYARAEESKEMLERVCSPEERRHVDCQECNKADRRQG